MKGLVLASFLVLIAWSMSAQQLLLLDRFNGNKVVNDSTITVFSSDAGIPELTQYFTMKNNTDRPLALFLRKQVHQMGDSTTDYFCFGIKCWPYTDTTDIADTIQPGAEDYTFASHVTHIRRFDIPQPPLPPGLSSITYTIFDHTSFPEPVEASVTVNYHLSGLGISDAENEEPHATVYPNPARDWLTIKIDGFKPGTYPLAVFNSVGALIYSTSACFHADTFRMPVNNFPPGLYFGSLASGSGTILSFRFQVLD